MEKITKTNTTQKETIKKESAQNLVKNNKDDEILKQLEELKASLSKKDEIINAQQEVIAKMGENSKNNETHHDVTGDLLEIIAQLRSENSKSQTRDVVKVIHLDNVQQSQFKLSNGRVLTFNSYGQIMPMSVIDAELLLNEYIETFKRGALTFDDEHIYMIRERGIDTSCINYKPLESIDKIPSLNDDELVALFKELSPFQREMMKSHIISELAKNKDYITVDRVRLLNKTSKAIYNSKTGGFEYIIEKFNELENLE